MPYDHALPTISVIVTTYNRPKSLRRLLCNLADQYFFRFQDLDVCVVDDGSSRQIGYPMDWTFYPIFDWKSFAFQCEYVYRERHPKNWPRPYTGKNKAVESTKGEVLLFLDDDLVLHRHHLRQVQFYHSLWKNIVLIPHHANLATQKYFTQWFPTRRDGEPGWISICGMSVRRELYEAVGGFDPTFETGMMGFADQDLGLRLVKEAGSEPVLAGDISVLIDDREQPSWRDYFGKKWREDNPDAEWDINGPLFWDKHPEFDRRK